MSISKRGELLRIRELFYLSLKFPLKYPSLWCKKIQNNILCNPLWKTILKSLCDIKKVYKTQRAWNHPGALEINLDRGRQTGDTGDSMFPLPAMQFLYHKNWENAQYHLHRKHSLHWNRHSYWWNLFFFEWFCHSVKNVLR